MTNHVKITSPAATDSMVRRPRTAPPTWRRQVIFVAATAVGVAGIVGVRAMPTADGSPNVAPVETTAATEPLIIPEEQAFIDAQRGRVPTVGVGTDPWCAMHRPC